MYYVNQVRFFQILSVIGYQCMKKGTYRNALSVVLSIFFQNTTFIHV